MFFIFYFCFLQDVTELLKVAKTLKLNVIGYSFHVGSNCLSADTFYNAIQECKKACDIAKDMNINISIIDIVEPTCDSIDLIQKNVMLHELAIGEWVYVEDFGANTVAVSSGFNGFKTSINKYI